MNIRVKSAVAGALGQSICLRDSLDIKSSIFASGAGWAASMTWVLIQRAIFIHGSAP